MGRLLKNVITIFMVCTLLSGTVMAETEKSDYKLDRVTVLSRHNIRSPLSGSGSLIGDIIPHEWFKWTSNPSELSLRGAILETLMGQYFRMWLEDEGLFPENYRPEEGEVRFYSNSKQRTLATTHYFSAGLLPAADVSIEHHGEYDTMDPTFSPYLTFFNDDYARDVVDQIGEKGGEKGIEGIHEKLLDAIKLLMDVTDMNESEAYKSGKFGDLLKDPTTMVLEEGEEPAMTGPIKTATSVADALTLQYYEEEDEKAAAFGHDLTKEDWLKIHSIVDTYTDMLFGTPLLSVNEANPLLKEIRSELSADDRKFTFLCGHDSNISSVLSALGVEEYELPETVEPYTPIGVKLVFERWLDKNDEAFYKVSLVYQSTDQLRNYGRLSLENPPMKVAIQFDGVKTNADGMIAEADLLALFDGAIGAYDRLVEQYSVEEADIAA
jgi:glucose-1-phosphatase